MADYRALYRKWRPTDFDDVCGQEAITDILKYEVANGKLSHAYLFCGSRGTGKTSCAKILAKAVNCENSKNGNPCNSCEACRSIDLGVATDVIEMDAASNNGVDNVRDMKDEIAFTPAVLKYRVYIIDEVHMMSASAFNALLKTLEEPPSYVIFILATTEFHKLPTTIVSRCQRFDFRRISSEVIMKRLAKIASAEGVMLDSDGARVIARAARGGMRDAVSLLELCSSVGKKIDASLVFDTVGTGNKDSAYRLIDAILNKDYRTVYKTVDEVVASSADISVFWQEIIDSYRDIMVAKNTDRAREYLDLTELEYETVSRLSSAFTPALLAFHVSILEGALSDMQRALNSKRSVAEIALTRMCDAKSTDTPEALLFRIEELERELSRLKLGGAGATPLKQTAELLPTTKETKSAPEPKKDGEDKKAAPAPKAPSADTEQPKSYAMWREVVERIGELKPSLAVKFSKSAALKRKDGSFLIRMNAFFAKLLVSSEQDLSLICGIIAEKEGTARENIKLLVEPIDNSHPDDFSDELEKAISGNM